jgi:hypothetical protein
LLVLEQIRLEWPEDEATDELDVSPYVSDMRPLSDELNEYLAPFVSVWRSMLSISFGKFVKIF